MANEKPVKKGPATTAVAPTPTPPPKPSAPVNPPPLFRRIDWITFLVTTLLVFIGYYLTLAPDVTLEDSGELATGSFYAGIPHPPGYPVWSVYTYFWTALLPFGSVAWRVALAEAFAGAVACGMLAFIVSRGSSMMIESIPALKDIERKWENAICVVAGFVTGILMGFDGFMWSQSVIVEVYSFSVLSFIGTILCLLRWTYAPHQRRYLYLAFFLFGVCFTNHQTLICAAVGIEIAILAVDRRIGRDLFMGNTLIFAFIMLVLDIPTLKGNPSLYLMFQIVGYLSAATFIWLTIETRKTADDWIALGRDVLLLGCFAYLLVVFLHVTEFLPPMDSHSSWFTEFHALGILMIGGCAWLTWAGPRRKDESIFGKVYIPLLVLSSIFVLILMALSGDTPDPLKWVKDSLWGFWGFMLPGLVLVCVTFWLTTRRRECGSDIKVGVILGVMWVLGASFYLYMAVSGMTCPPMQWGYPRTVEGFFHALSRGQYGNTVAVSPLQWAFIPKFWSLFQGIADEFSWVYVLVAMVPFFFYRRMQKRERAWMIGLTAMYFSLAILLLIMLDPQTDRQSRELTRVFFTSSHVIAAMMIGYGITLLMAALVVARDAVQRWLPFVTLAFVVVAAEAVVTVVFDMYGGDVIADGMKPFLYGIIYLAAAGLFWRLHGIERLSNLIATILMASIGLSLTCYGVWLSMSSKAQYFTSAHVVLHGLADKLVHGDATWEIYGALWLALMVIIVLALVWLGRTKVRIGLVLVAMTLMPLYSVMSHWSDNEERNHWFGYYFGHDMFTPPFTAPDGKLSYDAKLREQAMKGPNASLVYPEMTRNAILFGGTDPGRFCPTYMIFCESFVPPSCKPMDPVFDRRDVYLITQNALADGTYLEYIRSQYFRSAQIDPPFFSELLRTDKEKKDGFSTNFIAAAAGELLDKPFEAYGARVEARRRKEGVYPAAEIYEPSPEDSQKCFNDYYNDVMRRFAHDRQFPNEPKQMKPGEGADLSQDGKLQISGQVSVMAINGLLTKVIFDHNPTNEFFVEESFPLEWMYPHLTPFGVIMKINRDPLPELSEEICRRDHEFWSKYSERLIGNWITYDTPIKDICDFAEKVYLKRDFTGFTGDRKFIRDDQGQKAFSKLRSSIAGIYAWRVFDPSNHDPVVQQRMIKEADFAFKQSFAYCPYSPEAVYRYINLLALPQVNRLGDALLVAQTCLKLDPDNAAIRDVVKSLENAVKQNGPGGPGMALAQLEQEVKNAPTNFNATFKLASYYMQMNQQDKAFALLDGVINLPNADSYAIRSVVAAYAQLGKADKLEVALQRLTTVDPSIPEGWYDLAAIKATFGKNAEAVAALNHAFTLSDSRLAADPTQKNLRTEAAKDQRFDRLRADPQYQKLISQ